MSQDRSRTIIFIALGALFLVALCVVVIIVGRLFMQPASVSTQDPNLIYTAAAQTVQAQLTESSGSGGIPSAVVPTQTTGAVVLPTNTQAAAPTNTTIGGIKMTNAAIFISKASIFLPRYSGVRPTISPATNTATMTKASNP